MWWLIILLAALLLLLGIWEAVGYALFENSHHAQSPGRLPSGRPNFSLKSARIPAKKLLASG